MRGIVARQIRFASSLVLTAKRDGTGFLVSQVRVAKALLRVLLSRRLAAIPAGSKRLLFKCLAFP